MSIWTESSGIKLCTSLDLEPWRVVESQYNSSSRDLVDTREEHDLLEDLLEKSKPQLANNKHYLIFTPFRYPPLKYGSRFGAVYEPSLWYGSLFLKTAFAEVAFYRLKFINDSFANLEYIEIPMTAFQVYLQTDKGIDLTASAIKKYQGQISNKTSYEYSQQLGSEMRGEHIEAFIFTSARDKELGKNTAAFISDVFKIKDKSYIQNMQNWRCMADKKSIEFTRDEISYRTHLEFFTDDF
jgi:hypothetical protein